MKISLMKKVIWREIDVAMRDLDIESTWKEEDQEAEPCPHNWYLRFEDNRAVSERVLMWLTNAHLYQEIPHVGSDLQSRCSLGFLCTRLAESAVYYIDSSIQAVQHKHISIDNPVNETDALVDLGWTHDKAFQSLFDSLRLKFTSGDRNEIRKKDLMYRSYIWPSLMKSTENKQSHPILSCDVPVLVALNLYNYQDSIGYDGNWIIGRHRLPGIEAITDSDFLH